MKVIISYYYFNNFTGIIIDSDRDIVFYKNGKYHRENGPAINAYNTNGAFSWYYKGVFWGSDDDFTIKSWKKKVKELKRKERLNIFI
jgi:hypothetical protein